MTNDFAGFGNDLREKWTNFGRELHEKWAKMTTEEKVKFIDEREKEMQEHPRFSIEKIDEFCAKWQQMSREEKEAFIAEKRQHLADRHGHFGRFHHSDFCGRFH